MSQIIKQPNGKYALWSGVVDNFTALDCSPQDITDTYIEEETKRITKNVNDIIGKLEQGEAAYYQFTNSWEECLTIIQAIHGKKEVDKITKEMGNS